MAFGVQIKDAAGAVQVQYTSTLPRILGDFVTGTADGSISFPELVGGTPLFFPIGGEGIAGYLNMPIISATAAGFTWYFVSPVNRVSVRVGYGRIG